MCVGQVANLQSRDVVPTVIVQHLIPLWGLTTSEAA